MTHMNGVRVASADPLAPSRGWRLLLIAAAALEFLSGLRDLPVLFGNLSDVPGPGASGWIIAAKIALQPILGGAALMLAITDRIRQALLAMAAIIVMTWLSFLPSVAMHGLDLKGSAFVVAQMIFQIVLAPLLAAAVAALALRNENSTAAIALAILPTLVGVLSVLAFAIGVAIYGF